MCSAKPPKPPREQKPVELVPDIVIAAENAKTRKQVRARRTRRSDFRVDVGAAAPMNPGLTIGGS